MVPHRCLLDLGLTELRITIGIATSSLSCLRTEALAFYSISNRRFFRCHGDQEAALLYFFAFRCFRFLSHAFSRQFSFRILRIVILCECMLCYSAIFHPQISVTCEIPSVHSNKSLRELFTEFSCGIFFQRTAIKKVTDFSDRIKPEQPF